MFLSTMGILFRHLPKSEGVSPRWIGGAPLEVISLTLTPSRTLEPISIPATAWDVRTLATAFLPLLLIDAVIWSYPYPTLYTVAQLGMPPSIAGLLYFQTRAAFFDLLIKRGAVLGALLAAIDHVTAALTHALHADWVYFGPPSAFASGWVYRSKISHRPPVVGMWTSILCSAASFSEQPLVSALAHES